MIEYQVKHDQSLYTLEGMINRAIKEGWELAGNLQVIITYGDVINTKEFFQPMTRVLPEDPTVKWERD